MLAHSTIVQLQPNQYLYKQGVLDEFVYIVLFGWL